MAQYRTGTVTTTAASAIVTGTDTLWRNNVTAGDLFTVSGTNVYHEIASVDSQTQLTLAAAYPTTFFGKEYVIVSDFTPNRGYPCVNQSDLRSAEIFTRALRMIDADMGLVYGPATWCAGLASVTLSSVTMGWPLVGSAVMSATSGILPAFEGYIRRLAIQYTVASNTGSDPLYLDVYVGGVLTDSISLGATVAANQTHVVDDGDFGNSGGTITFTHLDQVSFRLRAGGGSPSIGLTGVFIHCRAILYEETALPSGV